MVRFSLMSRENFIETMVGFFLVKKGVKLWLDLLQFQDKNQLKRRLDF